MKRKLLLFVFIALVVVLVSYLFIYPKCLENKFRNDVVGIEFYSIAEFTTEGNQGDRIKINDRKDISVYVNENMYLEVFVDNEHFAKYKMIITRPGGKPTLERENVWNVTLYKEGNNYFLQLGKKEYQLVKKD